MASIRVLPDEVSRRIAAGEVIERPASVLKELLENSMDAGAGRVDVEALGAGRSLLRVSDDGRGMEPADCRAAFARHATSKISTLEDLSRLDTFGFRGEALFSIAAVSRVVLSSSTREAASGCEVVWEGGRLKSERQAPPAPGTRIEVRDLFFNTPARLKFLKSDSSERSHIARVVEEAALANPAVALGYRSEGRAALAFAAQKGGVEQAALARAREVLGPDLSRGLLCVSREGPLSLLAFLSPAESLVATRSFQFFFVNRRPVSSRVLQQALYRAYEPFRPKTRHPVAVLFVSVAPDQVDVNVHPTKREIRFRAEGALFEAVASSLSKALLHSRGIPTLSGLPAAQARPAPAMELRQESAPYRARLSETPLEGPPDEPAAAAPLRPAETPLWASGAVRYLGQIERAYLVFESSGGLLLIDQHAAQERVLFERYLEQIGSGKTSSQKLMLPIPLQMPASQIQRVLARRERLEAAGFELAPFGKTGLHVLSAPPLFHKAADLRDIVHRLLDHLLSAPAAVADLKYDAAATIACKAAVKAHDPLQEKEAMRLVSDLRLCSDGTRCPHGRPTMLSLNREELAHRFKRPGPPPL